MKKCIAHLSPEFSSHRMVAEYAQRFYFPAHQAASRLLAPSTPTTRVTGMDDPREAARLADQIARYRECWPAVSIHDVRIVPTTAHCEFSVSAMVRTPGLAPDQVSIQVVCGEVDAHGNIEQAHASPLTSEPAPSGDSFAFEGRIRVPGNCSPRYGVFIRVLPQSERLVSPFIPGLICNSPIVLLRPNDPAAGPGAWGGSTGGTGANGAHNGARRTTPPAKP
jgi:starch phosphorylase